MFLTYLNHSNRFFHVWNTAYAPHMGSGLPCQPTHAYTINVHLLSHHPHTCMFIDVPRPYVSAAMAYAWQTFKETTSLVEIKGGFPVFTESKTTTVLKTRNWTKGKSWIVWGVKRKAPLLERSVASLGSTPRTRLEAAPVLKGSKAAAIFSQGLSRGLRRAAPPWSHTWHLAEK